MPSTRSTRAVLASAFRFRWMPVAGIATMAREHDALIPPQYLMSELELRVEREPVAWDLVFQLGEPGDPTDDVTQAVAGGSPARRDRAG